MYKLPYCVPYQKRDEKKNNDKISLQNLSTRSSYK